MKKLTTQQFIDKLNKKEKEEGRLLEERESDKTQVIFFRKKPEYPKKEAA